MTAATFTQAAFRFYEDGTESGSTAIANQDTNITRTVTSDSQLHLRIRFQSTNAGNQAATDDYKLQRWLQRPGASAIATWADVTTTSPGVKAIASGSLNEGDATTNRLGAGTGSFVAGECSEDGIVDDLLITANNYTELLYSLVLEVDEVGHGDIIQFRVQRNAAITGITYTVTPQITISKIATGFGALKGTLTGTGTSIPNPASATGSVSVAVGDLIWVQLHELGGLTVTACTDNNTNAYTAVNAGTLSGNAGLRAYFHRCTSAFTLTQVDLTVTASANNYSILVAVFEGTFASSPLDANPANGTDASSPVDWPATGTLTQADELVLGAHAGATWDLAAATANLVVASPQQLVAIETDSQNGAGSALLGQVVAATTTITLSMTSVTTPGANGGVQITASFKKEVAGAHQGNATFGGAGDLSNAARQNNQAASTLPGTSTASIATTQTHQAAARFAGAGSLSAQVEKFIFATFAGVGSLSARATLGEQAVAVFAGAGSLSANSQVSKTGEATFQGSGDVSVLARLNARIAAIFAGSGNLSVNATQISAGGQVHVGEATFNGAGALSALATLNEAAAATFAGAGSLSAQADKSKAGQATFSGAGALSARVTGRLVAFATFGGAGSLSVNTISAQRAAATFNGSGSLSAFSQAENIKDGQATFAGSGNLSANVTRQNLRAAATFAGAGPLSAQARQGQQAAARLDGSGSLSAVVTSQRMQISARFVGDGQFSVLVTQGHRAQATMEGRGDLSVDATSFAFGEHVGEAIFGGQGGMRVLALQFGPRRAGSRRSFAAPANDRRNTQGPMRRAG